MTGGCGLALLGLLLGLVTSSTWYLASAQLIRNESASGFRDTELGETFRAQPLSDAAFRNLLRSPELAERVSEKSLRQVSAKGLAGRLQLSSERNIEFITATLADTDPQSAVNLVNLFASEAAQMTKEMQAAEAKGAIERLQRSLKEAEREQAADQENLLTLSRGTPRAAVSAADIRQDLRTAQKELVSLLAQYTTNYPKVKEQYAKIDALENQMKEAVATGTAVTTNARLEDLEKIRLVRQNRLREAQHFANDAPGYYRVFAAANKDDAVRYSPKLKVVILTLFGGFAGICFAVLAAFLVEISDRRAKTIDDVQRVTGLPVLATLGDLSRMSREEQAKWAFRTWTILQGKIDGSPGRGVVCGFTSSDYGEGRSTWVKLLGEAASQRGHRVLTIATRSMPPYAEPPCDGEPVSEQGNASPNGKGISSNAASPPRTATGSGDPTGNALAHPDQISEQLAAPDAPPMVHIPLPGWAWDYERRKQWQAALRHWRSIENVVILVELPPASLPEAVLLAEQLPQLIWLIDGEKADPAATRDQLELLRHAHCNLVGAVLNRETVPVVKENLLRWAACIALLLAGHAFTARAAAEADPIQPVAKLEAKPSFSSSPRKRAAWQERLTLGPGDTLNFSLFGRPELTHQEVDIGPDGRVSYLQAQDVLAAGLTIDELREKLDAELANYYRAPRTILTPVTFRSKKYFVLGSVATNGVFTLDRPMTIIEAIARARGLQTGLRHRDLVEVADLQRTFLVRRGARMEVDFERLFLQGDLSQNVPLEPDDYLFFPPAEAKEIYVIGEVRTPGPVPYTPNSSVVTAITTQGGFTDRAWRKRILVIRGSLNQPQTFVVDATDVLYARDGDFILQPRDIVYIHHRPWIKAEELLDLAASAFVQAAVITWTGGSVGQIIK